MKNNENLFRGKYRIDTVRADWWEYCEGMYHIIICTAGREHYFGEISCHNGENEMRLTEIGKFVDDEIPKIMDHYWYAYVPVWTVMPDHIHLIIMIDVRGRDDGIVETCRDTSLQSHRDTSLQSHRDTSLQSHRDTSLQSHRDTSLHPAAPKTGSLGLIIGRFKQAITMYARAHQIPFKWQSRFYDVILFDQIDFDRTRKYIENNVANWHHDRENHLPDNPDKMENES